MSPMLPFLFPAAMMAQFAATPIDRSIDPSVDSVPPRRVVALPSWEASRLYYEAISDTVKPRPKAIQYSDVYHTRVTVHKVLSFTMVPLFIGSAYTGFELRSKRDLAPKWAKDAHGPLAAGTAIVFGMNSLTGVWNLIEGWNDPKDKTRRLIHGAMFLAAGAGFAYVTAAGDNISASGRQNHWHRDVALASMGVSLVSWTIMLFR